MPTEFRPVRVRVATLHRLEDHPYVGKEAQESAEAMEAYEHLAPSDEHRFVRRMDPNDVIDIVSPTLFAVIIHDAKPGEDDDSVLNRVLNAWHIPYGWG